MSGRNPRQNQKAAPAVDAAGAAFCVYGSWQFGHLIDVIGIKRFSLRGKKKVNGQWQMKTMLHNMTRIHRFGMI